MDSKKPEVSVIISNYNNEDLLKKNLSKIAELMDDRKNFISEIIIVDDGSTDQSVKYIKDNFPKIKLIRHKINRGVPAGFNTGARTAKGDLLLMISNDMIPDKKIISSLLKHFEDPKVFAVSFHEKGIGPEKGYWKDGFVQFKNDKESKETQNTFYVRKGEGMYSRKIWIELGGMDEKLFLPFYWEDLDICFRAAKRGYKNLWEPESKVMHEHWGTMGKFPKKFVEEKGELHMLFFIWKNIQSINFIRKHIAGLFARIARNPGYLKIIFLAIGKLPAILKQRRKEAHECKISDEAVFSRFSS